MSTQTFLVVGATGKTGQHTVERLLEKGHGVRAMVHKEDERSEALRSTGVEVVAGELLRELATTVCDEWGVSIRRALGGYVGLGGTPFSSGGTLL